MPKIKHLHKHESIRKMYQQGQAASAIALKHGCSPQYVYMVVKKEYADHVNQTRIDWAKRKNAKNDPFSKCPITGF